MLSAFNHQQHHNQFGDPQRVFKLCHMQQQHQQQQLSATFASGVFLQTDANNNNNALQPPLTPSTPTTGADFENKVAGFLGLPYHCYNYQDFPVYFNAAAEAGAVVPQGVKTWRAKRAVTRKRKQPEKVLRDRQLRRNERERARQNRLNDAFDVLRNTIPDFLTPCKTGQKLTQIETLKLAKHYIGSMRDLLTDGVGVASHPRDAVIKNTK